MNSAADGLRVVIPEQEEEVEEVEVAIVGGGLSGLVAATLLPPDVTSYVVLEAHPSRFGGRLLNAAGEATAASTFPGAEAEAFEADNASNNAVDLGAAWVWPGQQPEMLALLSSLGLKTFAQPGMGEGEGGEVEQQQQQQQQQGSGGGFADVDNPDDDDDDDDDHDDEDDDDDDGDGDDDDDY